MILNSGHCKGGGFIKRYDLRVAVVFALVLVMLLIPTVRLGIIIRRDGYDDAAVTQSVYTVKIGSARGTFYDRNMQKLTNCGVCYVGTAGYSADPTSLTAAINSIAKEPKSVLDVAKSGKPFVFDTVDQMYSDEILSFPVYKRYNSLGSHLIGYPTSVSESGYTGLEAAFAQVLDKYYGEISVSYTVDATGRSLAGIEPQTDNTMYLSNGGVVLTLDKGLQEFCAELLDGVCGAITVMSTDGELLACVSSPTFDPDSIERSIDREDSPFLNRALSAYDVGSVFKTVVTAAALEIGVAEERSYVCNGYIDVGGVLIRCHNRSGHGEMNLRSALVNSCNPYFIDLAAEVGREKILDMAEKMGFGREIILADGVYSKQGNLPTDTDLSPPAALANFAIGQGSLLATPLQITAAVNCIASRGSYVYPRLVIGEVNEEGEYVEKYGVQESYTVMREETAEILLSNMSAVFEEGSLNKYKPDKFSAAGKTSTAQTGITASDGHSVCQAWVAGIYPASEPFCTVTVFVEDGTSGASACGPIFKSVCDYIAKNLL